MKKGKICVAISMAVICVCAIGIGLVKTVNMSNANPNENFSVEFKINAPATEAGKIHLLYDAKFDTNYFEKPSTVFNKELADISIRMCSTACTTAESYVNYGSALSNVSYVEDDRIDTSISRNGYLTDTYKKMGFSNDVYYKYDESLNDATDTVAHGIASREITIDGKKYNLVNIAIRSSSYGAEWASNFNLSNEAGVTGFEVAAKDVYKHVVQYLKTNRLGKNTKIWISGFSRGGAVANIAAAYINRACENGTIKVDRKNVYAYTFAAPNGVFDKEEKEIHKEIYNNIFNVTYEADVVPVVAPKVWGYKKYGKEYILDSIHLSARTKNNIENDFEEYIDEIPSSQVELVKRISDDYYKMRYGAKSKAYNEKKGKVFEGFTVDKTLLTAFDDIFLAFGDTVDNYEKSWQSVLLDIVPFITKKDKKYDETTKQWVNYDNLKEYIEEKHGEEVIENAVDKGLYSQEEHDASIEKIETLEKTKAISEETSEVLEDTLDTYYGVKVMAANHNLSKEEIVTVSENLYDKMDEILLKVMPIGDTANCVKNHYMEFYMAYMNNYNVATKKIVK